jgi:RHS repeat-associated protein
VRNSYTNGLLIKAEQGTVNSQSDSDWSAFSSLQEAQTDYDTNARPVVQKLVSGSTVYALTQTSYDGLGRPECSAQRMNPAVFGTVSATSACALGTQGTGAGDYGPDRIARNLYDAAGRVYQTRTAVGTADEANEATTTFTANGQVETVTDGEGNKTTYEYDGHDRLAKTRFPSTTKGAGTSSTTDFEQPTYESLASGTRTTSLVVAYRNRANQTANFGYDALGRQTSKDLPGSEPDVAYGYDLLGRLTSASQTGHALSFTYDALGRVLNQTGPLGTFASEWDLAGRRTRLTWPDSFYVTYDYLVTGEMTAIRESGATSGIGVLASFAYDQLGRRTSLTRGNGTVTGYTFDPVSRLAQMTQDIGGTARDLTVDFAYNPASQIASTTRSNDAYAWTGHGSGTTNASSNGLNQIGSWTSSLGYDSKGNITSDGSYTYAYSSENLLTSLANPAGTQQTWSTFAYDPLMRLVVIDSSNNVLDARLGYDGEETVLEDYGDGRKRRYVHGPGVDEPLVSIFVNGTGSFREWYHADERGSIVAISNASGAAGATGRYDEYGAGTGVSRFHYTGQYWLADANLHYYRARIYDARLGRFLQPDPIGYGGGMNMYGYVGGDPINSTDPTGTTTYSSNRAIPIDNDDEWLPLKAANPLTLSGNRSRDGMGTSDLVRMAGGRHETAAFERAETRLDKAIKKVLPYLLFPAPAGPEKEGIGGAVTERGNQISGKFPPTAAPGEILYRAADAKVTHYMVYGADGLPHLRVDMVGKAHGGIPTPHSVDYFRDRAPNGTIYIRPGRTRPASWLERTR